MKWAFGIQQKIKLALLLACMMLVILVVNFVERRNVLNLHTSFISIYKDRLIPSGDISTINGNLYKKRILLERNLTIPEMDVDDLKARIESINQKNDSLISAFRTTYLVHSELDLLDSLLANLTAYNNQEKTILKLMDNGSDTAATLLYKTESIRVFETITQQLAKLIGIQTIVGKELLADSEKIASRSKLLSTFQISTVIVLGLLIQILVMASRAIDVKKPKDFHLN